MNLQNKPRVIAVASGGGHWVQLRRIRPAWEGCQVTYVTTYKYRYSEVADDLENGKNNRLSPVFYSVIDANRWEKIKLLKQLFQISLILLRVRPHIIVSTGAAPGYFALRIGKLLGARTIWIDSIANAATLSLSGKKVKKYADLWLTQWEHLIQEEDSSSKKLRFEGSVL